MAKAAVMEVVHGEGGGDDSGCCDGVDEVGAASAPAMVATLFSVGGRVGGGGEGGRRT